ncbi:hypothetical protein BLNAU_22995 [Blattamonas nauphoetae]|uniref:Uncharacterized protein n=1 Tax=Blattamonas nauphoetae TaxID=2049346 RepID=A0ABQ9WRI0_9EUKA|nr:hypothetical protein BLNAU_22995 [Blattamonas nauphoetae]
MPAQNSSRCKLIIDSEVSTLSVTPHHKTAPSRKVTTLAISPPFIHLRGALTIIKLCVASFSLPEDTTTITSSVANSRALRDSAVCLDNKERSVRSTSSATFSVSFIRWAELVSDDIDICSERSRELSVSIDEWMENVAIHPNHKDLLGSTIVELDMSMQGSNCNDGSIELTIEKETSLVVPDIVRRNGLSTPHYLMSVTLIEQFPEGNSTASISTTPVSTARLIGIGAFPSQMLGRRRLCSQSFNTNEFSSEHFSPPTALTRELHSGFRPENPPDLKDSHR